MKKKKPRQVILLKNCKKLMRIMKITLVCLLLGTNMAWAGLSYAQVTSISLDLKNVKLEKVFDEICKQTEFEFFYNNDQINTSVKVSINSDKAGISEVLDKILPKAYEYKISDRYILISKKAVQLQAQPSESKIRIIGNVTDQKGESIIGANIIEKGTTNGVITDINGNFSIEVSFANAILIVSYIGYQPLEHPLKGEKDVTLTLIEDSKALEEVIVVGYSKQRKETMVGAVASITTKDLTQSPTANINNALAGRLPGLIANQYQGGEPGVDKAEVFIRGKSTFNDQSPIVIVDGVERDMTYLSADEIETFTILKDASATAQYGIRGANGVVVITTKRGQANERATVNFKASYGINEAVKFPSYLGSADYAMLYNEAMVNDAKMKGLSDDEISKLNLFTDDAISAFRNGQGYNWDYFDYAFKPTHQQDYLYVVVTIRLVILLWQIILIKVLTLNIPTKKQVVQIVNSTVIIYVLI